MRFSEVILVRKPDLVPPQQSGVQEQGIVRRENNLGSFGVGFLTDRYGLFYAFGVGLVSLVLSLICVNFHPEVSPERAV